MKHFSIATMIKALVQITRQVDSKVSGMFRARMQKPPKKESRVVRAAAKGVRRAMGMQKDSMLLPYNTPRTIPHEK
jgi:hypothetical protein